MIGRGSSPLTRGKLIGGPPRPRWRRLIPAHAGKTIVQFAEQAVNAAHPRSRGENVHGGVPNIGGFGSSPLTRGKLEAGALSVTAGRLIPAHAGKTRLRRLVRSSRAAHPRSRGENVGGQSWSFRRRGSSPLTRGKPGPRNPTADHRRLIPAHAGKTHELPRPSREHPAHPRSRGENTTGTTRRSGRHGSSPLTRGKPSHSVHCDR